jgi:hypothetical protein
MTLESMAALSDDPVVGLQAMVMCEVIGAFLRGEAAKGVGDGLPEVEDGLRGGGAQ